jgi:hypothetical protein
VKNSVQTRQNLFDFAENRFDCGRTAVELELGQEPNQGSTFIADRVTPDF